MVGVKHIASVSFGKDSLAMLLLLIEEGWPLDEVVFYDTGMEFSAIYGIRDRVKKLLDEKDVAFTILKPGYDFEWKMFDKPVNGKNGFLCSPDDSQEFADAICRLKSDTELRKKCSENNRKAVVPYCLDHVKEEVVKLFE